MAKTTSSAMRQQIIYSIFVRNFSKEGTFQAVIPELDRIKALGVDMIWFMPIHPLGEVARKGQEGSPYAIKDYRSVNPAYGTMADFEQLCDAIHARGMKVMIDVVYNHTSPDSVLVEEHPEWFYYKPNGQRGNRVGDWTDIVDLDYTHRGLWDYQIETLVNWARLVDGFRCDVAPLVPIEFWLEAREVVAKVKQDFVWLSESIHLEFIRDMRAMGVLAQSDCEIYQAFDMTYDYDVRDAFEDYVKGTRPLSYFVDRLNLQDVIYPANYVKMRNLENHDNPRIKALVPDSAMLQQWTAFMYFQKGSALIYNGQEVQASHVPTLFDMDPIEWDWTQDLSPLMTRLAEIKREILPLEAKYTLHADDALDTVVVHYEVTEGRDFVGVCSLKGKSGEVVVPLSDGVYENLLTHEMVEVREGKVAIGQVALALQAK